MLDSAFLHCEESLALRREVFSDDNVRIASKLVTHGRLLADLGGRRRRIGACRPLEIAARKLPTGSPELEGLQSSWEAGLTQ